jgi:cellulose biosynthesis protein BcsQ
MPLCVQANAQHGTWRMSAVAVYNLKGGVGKTTAAVNVAYLAAATGQRVLLWDLDPQGASSFILRVRARVGNLRRKTLRHGETFSDAIKETDHRNLDLLPADFSYRKFDRLLDHLGKPVRVIRTLLETLGADYDVVFLDCPAGFSLLTESVLETVDLCLVPTIPTPLSVRTLARILKWTERRDASSHVAAFFSMVDRRKMLHRRACEWSIEHRGNFLGAQIPCASVVEQMTVRRLPLPEFAGRDPASTAFVALWSELCTLLEQRRGSEADSRGGLRPARSAIESLSAELERALERESGGKGHTPVLDLRGSGRIRSHLPASFASGAAAAAADRTRSLADCPSDTLVHSFDTEDRDLARSGHVLELRECAANLVVVAGRMHAAADVSPAQVQIDKSWALQILSGEVSPVVVLERRLGRPGPPPMEEIRSIVGRRRLCRIESRIIGQPQTSDCESLDPGELPAAAISA